MIAIKRVFEAVVPEDGRRFLVDRLCMAARYEQSGSQSRQRASRVRSQRCSPQMVQSPLGKMAELRKRYSAELNANPDAWAAILEAARHRDVTLLYGASDLERNNAIVLRDYLLTRLRRIEAKEGRSGLVHRI